jgi:hypothetical protein
MKIINQHLIAAAAAILLTTASLGAVFNNVSAPQAAAMEIDGIKVTNLAPVTVYPTADNLRSAGLLTDVGVVAFAALPGLGGVAEAGDATPLNLLGSQLAMPYYSFGNKFGRISKE